jgi:hypothetical protein
MGKSGPFKASWLGDEKWTNNKANACKIVISAYNNGIYSKQEIKYGQTEEASRDD